jgi:integrase
MDNFTVKELDKLPTPKKGKQDIYHDNQVKGLSLKITGSGIKIFFVRKNLNNKKVYITIGHYPNTTIQQARNKARDNLNLLANGINPNAKAKESKLQAITLNQVLNDYITSRGTNLKATTKSGYLSVFKGYLSDWKNKELLNISRDMVEQKHRKITKQSPTRANTTMRLLRALFNYAMGEYETAKGEPIILHNPTQRLSHIKAWNKEQRRQIIIKPYELAKWWQSLHELPTHELNNKKPNQAETVRDFLIFVLFTGLRRREASNLKWADIDFIEKSFTITDTKNTQPHSLPLTDFLIDLLNERKANTSSLFIFESTTPDKPINDPKKQLAKVREISGIDFNIHDLRRTFITIAESLDIRDYILKRLMNHKDPRDVTAGYIISSVERLREPMNKITDYILEQCEQQLTQLKATSEL